MPRTAETLETEKLKFRQRVTLRARFWHRFSGFLFPGCWQSGRPGWAVMDFEANGRGVQSSFARSIRDGKS